MDFTAIVTVFVACLVGCWITRSAAPASHTPLLLVTNAISSVVIIGALIPFPVTGSGSGALKWLALAAVVLASINIFGGFALSERLRAKDKKERPAVE